MRALACDLLLILERPDIPLHTYNSECDIRDHVKKRKIGNSATLRFYRKLELHCANIMAKTDFKAIIDDGAEHVIDEESQEFESGWTRRTADLSPYCDKRVTLKFVVTATDPMSTISRAKAWIDDIVISGDR